MLSLVAGEPRRAKTDRSDCSLNHHVLKVPRRLTIQAALEAMPSTARLEHARILSMISETACSLITSTPVIAPVTLSKPELRTARPFECIHAR